MAEQAEIDRLRRMAGVPDVMEYADTLLADYIDRHAGDLHAAAADVYDERAAAVAANYDATADGTTLQKGQQPGNLRRMAEYHRARMRVKYGSLHKHA